MAELCPICRKGLKKSISEVVGGSNITFCSIDCKKKLEAVIKEGVPRNPPPIIRGFCPTCGIKYATKSDKTIDGTSINFCSLNCILVYERMYSKDYYGGQGGGGSGGAYAGGAGGIKGAGQWLEKAATGTSGGPSMGAAAEHQLNQAGLGLAVSAGKLVGKAVGNAVGNAIAEEKAREKEEDARRQAKMEAEEAEKENIFGMLKTLEFKKGDDATAIANSLDSAFSILETYTYELEFPMGLKGPCTGPIYEDHYKKDIWKRAEKHIEKQIAVLQKLGDSAQATAFTAQLQEGRDKVDPKKVKERLLAEKESGKQAKAEEKAQKQEEKIQEQEKKHEEIALKKDENKEKLNDLKEKTGGFFGGLKSGEVTNNATGKFKDGFGGLGDKLGGLFKKK